MVSCSDLDLTLENRMAIKLPWMLAVTASASIVISRWLPSAVIICQSAHLHPIIDLPVTISLNTQLPDLPSITIGSRCGWIRLQMVCKALAYPNSVYLTWSFTTEKAETWAILTIFILARVLAATCVLLGTKTVLSFGCSVRVKSLICGLWYAKMV